MVAITLAQPEIPLGWLTTRQHSILMVLPYFITSFSSFPHPQINPFSSSLSTISLFLALPEIEPFSFNDNGVNGGTSVRVLCTIIAGDQPVNIKWMKNGEPILRRSQKIDETTVILSLRQLQLEDTGNYTCVAQNQAGSAVHSAALRVKGTVFVIT